jgi:hypothetical protein
MSTRLSPRVNPPCRLAVSSFLKAGPRHTGGQSFEEDGQNGCARGKDWQCFGWRADSYIRGKVLCYDLEKLAQEAKQQAGEADPNR